MSLSQTDIVELLDRGIPHRVRAALAISGRLRKELGGRLWYELPKSREDAIARRCETDAVWEGRLAAIRWLVELVGVTRDKNGNAIAKPRTTTDVFLDDLPGGSLIQPKAAEAARLAAVWKGSTQGSSHPTINSGHPSVDEPEIAAAMDIILDHLQTTVYAHAGKNLLAIALQPAG